MLGTKYADRAAIIAISLALAICLALSVFSGSVFAGADKGITMEYESELFDHDSVMTVDIIMDEDDWQSMLDNAANEEYVKCDVKINGTTFYSVGIRPKGNTSLSSIVSDPTTDRYSFKIEFDRYVDGQTCFGLDKLILNNNYADATNMKEAIAYDMFNYLGADSSLYNYAQISVNGEYWGVYLALEAVEDSFMLRNYGTENGFLYKPDSMEMGGGGDDKGGMDDFTPPDNADFDFSDFGDFPANDGSSTSEAAQGTAESDSDSDSDAESRHKPDNNGGFDMSGLGDIDLDALAEILNNAGYTELSSAISGKDFSAVSEALQSADIDDITQLLSDNGFTELAQTLSSIDFTDFGGGFDMDDFAGGFGGSGGSDLNYIDDELDSYSDIWDGEITDSKKSDRKRVVAALKAASEGTDLEEYLDIDNLLKYMAAHEFVVNLDSLSGNMAHNYYLYESGGTINIIPWDYNLSFGGMNGTASDAVNDAIDTPFSGTNFFDAILENEEYLAQYHEYLRILCEEYVGGGVFEQTYNRIRSQIDELVNTDPNAFYTYDEYDAAAQTLVQTVNLRAQSVSGQLDGTIPSTDDGQRQDSSALTDTSDLDISVMGGMGGGNGGGFGGFNDDRNAAPQGGFTPPDNSDGAGDNISGETGGELTSDTSANTSSDSNEDTASDTSAVNAQDSDRPAPPNGDSGQFGEMPSDFPDNASPPDNGFGITDGGANAKSSGEATTESAESSEVSSAKTTESEPAAQTSDSSANGENSPQPPNGGNGGGRGNNFPGNTGGGDFGGSQGESASSSLPDGLVPILISAGVIAAALVFAALFKRRH